LELALIAYQKARALGEPDPYLAVEIAHALAQLGRFAEARAELDAHNAGGALSNAIRGQAFLVEDNAAAAAPYLELAIQQSPRDPWYHWLLGIAYARLNRPAEARAVWRASLEVRPGFTPSAASLACGSDILIPEDCLPEWARSTG
jgi:Flp pilus assembly protein TadD